MNAVRSVDFFIGQHQKAVNDLDNYFHDPDMEILHEFRVEVKKIRSVLIQMEHVTGSKKVKKAHRQIRHIFHKAGEIRELQLESAWLHRHRKFNLLRVMEYDKMIKKYDRSFHLEIPEMLHSFIKIRASLEKIFPELTQKKSDHYITKKWLETLHDVLAVKTETGWHETRKKIKQLLYARNWIAESVVLPVPVNRIFMVLDNLQSLIGQWHDLLLLEKKLFRMKKKIKGHVMLIREQQIAIKKLKLEKESVAKQVIILFRRIRKNINTYR
jgi:CHAD domain-containing protein